MTEVEFLRRELERQLKAVDDLNKMVKDLSQITFESKMDKWLKASKTKNEPVAWGMEKDGVILDVICPAEHEREEGEYTIPLYTHPKEWVGLTEEDLKPICDEWRIVYGTWTHDFAREIETKLKEKNHGN